MAEKPLSLPLDVASSPQPIIPVPSSSSGISCRDCSKCYISDTYSPAKFVSEMEADDATSAWRPDATPNQLLVPTACRNPCCADPVKQSFDVDMSSFYLPNVTRHNGSSVLTSGAALVDRRGMVADVRCSLDRASPDELCGSSLSADRGDSNHSDDTKKGSNKMLYLSVPGYRQIRRRERLEKKGKKIEQGFGPSS